MNRRADFSPDLLTLVTRGAIGGVIAGVVFAIFDMVMAAAFGNPFIAPLRMIAGILLGPAALTPAVDPTTAVIVGLAVHFVLSAAFGGVFGVAIRLVPTLAQSSAVLVLSASVYGLLLWLVNFQVIGALFFPWFTQIDQLVFGFIAHTFFFVTPLGLYLARTLPSPERTGA